MNILEIITKKRDKKELTKDEIQFFINGYVKEDITDYQAAALIMAMYINGMNKKETTDLTLSMANSGDILDLSEISNSVIDKHSTGGVGDKITIILIPIIASLGIPVAKMSGRGLGFTGGTIDKLESIPGFKTELPEKEFIKNVKDISISIIGQTKNLAPADKKIYALRDTISCIDNIPLIASSIMSKKIAAGAGKIVLDVTVGKGAFMKTKVQAEKLALTMKEIGKLAKRETVCILTNMDQPVGYYIGNTLEIIESINCLKGEIPEDIKKVIEEIGAYIIKLAGKGENLEQNKKMIIENIKNGKAYNKFLELVERQGGNIEYIKDINKFNKAKYIKPVISEKNGYINEINAEKIGILSVKLGAGRMKKEDKIDNTVGIVLNKKITDEIKKGDILGYIHSNDINKAKEAIEELKDIIKISKNKPSKENIILKVI